MIRFPSVLNQLTASPTAAAPVAPALTSVGDLDDPQGDSSTNGLLRAFPPSGGGGMHVNGFLHYHKHPHTLLPADMTLSAVVGLLVGCVRPGAGRPTPMRACALWALQGMVHWSHTCRHAGTQKTLATALIRLLCDRSGGNDSAEQVLRKQLVLALKTVVAQADSASLAQFVHLVQTELAQLLGMRTAPAGA